MTAAERAERTRAADELCAKAFASTGCPDTGVALVAVGGYGRQELAPFSDLDVVLVHDPDIELGDWAGQIWYPLWDSGANVDHSVRTVEEVLDRASADLRVASGHARRPPPRGRPEPDAAAALRRARPSGGARRAPGSRSCASWSPSAAG